MTLDLSLVTQSVENNNSEIEGTEIRNELTVLGVVAGKEDPSMAAVSEDLKGHIDQGSGTGDGKTKGKNDEDAKKYKSEKGRSKHDHEKNEEGEGSDDESEEEEKASDDESEENNNDNGDGDGKGTDWEAAGVATVSALGGAATGGTAALAAINAAGFGSLGPVAGSIAAGVQTSATASGSLFALCQSAGMTGALGTLALPAAIGGAVLALPVGLGGYYGLKYLRGRGSETGGSQKKCENDEDAKNKHEKEEQEASLRRL